MQTNYIFLYHPIVVIYISGKINDVSISYDVSLMFKLQIINNEKIFKLKKMLIPNF